MNTKLAEKFLEKVLTDGDQSESDCPFEVGEAYFIRTVTYHVIGRVKVVKGAFLVLDEASWIADSGRFSKAMEKGELNEVEYVGRAIVSLNAIADAYPWPHKPPKETK